MNFLPTTTFTSPLITWAVITTVAFGVFSLFAVIVMFFPPRFKKESMMVGAVLGLWAIALASGIGSQVIHSKIQSDLVPQISSNLVSNLKQKYAINDVDYEERDYEELLGERAVETDSLLSVLASSPKAQTIIVFTEDNEKVLFTLTQDRVTSEPTLSDYPYHAGSNSVADITRK